MKFKINKSNGKIILSKGKGFFTILLNGSVKEQKKKIQITLKDWLKKHWFYNLSFCYFLLCIYIFESVNLSVHNDASKTHAVKIIIKGRVLDVSYRYFTLRQALSFNIWNQVNGDVKAYAEGNRESLDQFINYLKKGPTFSRVDEVILNWEAEDKTYNEFNIL